MKCAVIGGSTLSSNISSSIIQELDKVALYCANNNIDVLTGGCAGYPLLFGKKCIEYNVRVFG